MEPSLLVCRRIQMNRSGQISQRRNNQERILYLPACLICSTQDGHSDLFPIIVFTMNGDSLGQEAVFILCPRSSDVPFCHCRCRNSNETDFTNLKIVGAEEARAP
jgi:hypothetical protein